MQASEQQRADRPIQLAPPGDDEIVAAHGRKEERRAKEPYQPPPCDIRMFKPSTGVMEHLVGTLEEEAELAK